MCIINTSNTFFLSGFLDPMVERGSKMEVALFFIFLITNLFVVLICQYSYGKRDQYENGMLMGVHIPASALEQEEVKTICAKSKKEWRLFNRGNLIVSILITFLCFWDISFFIIIYFVWMIEYMCGLWCLVIFPHRKMYEIKKQNQWIDERSRRVVPVDTEITSFLDKKPWSVRWYIPLFILLFLSGIWEKEIWTGGMEFYGERIIFLATLGISVVFFLIHIGVSKKQDVVYSEHREINLAANQPFLQYSSSSILYGSATVRRTFFCFLIPHIIGRRSPKTDIASKIK